MMDTLAVALRVAEEAIEEAISKAESHGDSLVGPPAWWEATRWECPSYQEQVPMVGGHATAVRLCVTPLYCFQAHWDNEPHVLSILFLPQDKQNEASYLRDHKQELAEELASTILQRVG